MRSNEQFFLESTDSEELGILENPSTLLRKLGLSVNQSKVYLCLSKLGPKTASHLSQILEIPRTETYHILKTLQGKGCVVILNHRPLKFGAISIDEFLEKIIDLEKEKMNKLIDTLELIKKLKISNLDISIEKAH